MMIDRPNTRFIARLDVKGEKLIKAIHLEGLREVGDPNKRALHYYQNGADELIYMDLVASLYGRSNLVDIVHKTTQDIFIPITVGGGVRSIEDAQQLLDAGADKVAINTAAVHNPSLLSNLSERFGSQCIVLSVEAKKVSSDSWEVYTDCAREASGLLVDDWVAQALKLGIGEILLTSIDMEGTRKGFDIELIKSVSAISTVPVIASGGYGKPEDIEQACMIGAADALAFADALHFDRSDIATLKQHGLNCGLSVRA